MRAPSPFPKLGVIIPTPAWKSPPGIFRTVKKSVQLFLLISPISPLTLIQNWINYIDTDLKLIYNLADHDFF